MKQQHEALKTLNPNKVWIPTILGLAFVVYQFYTDPNLSPSTFRLVSDAKPWPIILAFLVIIARDAGYVYRIRTLTEKRLSWVRSIYVIILWEFASAVTPSVVGGTAVAVFILLMEGITIGRASAYVMLSSILDNGFFILFAPLVLLYTGQSVFPVVDIGSLKLGLSSLFWISYALIVLYCLIFSYALLIRPSGFKWLLLKVTSLRPLRKWRRGAYNYGNEIVEASKQLAGKAKGYWIRIIVSTIFVWCARYTMLNCLISAYADVDFTEQMGIFGKQIIMWIIMLVSPTPGSSGTAEYFFTQFFNGYLGDYTFITSILWRSLSYYPYLIIGAIFLRPWLVHSLKNRSKEQKN
ncbi:hypothetical protein FUAX_11940 [Fulvitalea axinellae]|uniref:Flippase-like domain-containing protein n=1 Tax=Fulvitalea axinellae TaxID=1182444 RepID=A0AAU9CP99_9BACT|nr:hypothetical protein FUAX_11940 [Fulvitalea axinellae]